MKALDNLSKSVKHFTDKNAPVVLIEESNYFSIPFFILGAVVGAIAALMYTPDTGENNRKKIMDKINELKQDDDDLIGTSYSRRDLTEENVKDLEYTRSTMSDF